jgi:serine protease
MKKWMKSSAIIGASSMLVIPNITMAAEPNALQDRAEKPDILKKILGSDKDQMIAAYKKQKEDQMQTSSDTLVIKYEKPLSKVVHQKIGTRVVRSFKDLGYDVVKLSKGQKMNDVLRYYRQLEGVSSVAPSALYKSMNSGMNDPKASDMYHLNLLEIDKALQLAGDHEVTVAVIDTGIDYKHPELKSQVLPPYNAVSPADMPLTDVHGTHVSGIIASEGDNGIGGHGINPNAKILPIDVFNGGFGASDYAIAEGILYAVEQGADVINMSLGGYGESKLLEEAVAKAIEAGVTVVAAAGNEGWDEYALPASYEGVISVGSTNSQNKLSSYSNYGPSVDIVAPGEAVYNTVYDFMKGSSFAKLSGTSMASPVVAGVASLLKSKYPDLKPHEVEAILENTAKNLGEEGYDLKFANGLVDPVAALQYDLSKLPKKYSYKEEEAMLEKAEALSKEEENVHNGSFTLPEEVHWYKVDLQGGESVQTVLEGSDMYDYEMKLSFYPETPNENKDEEELKVEVNEVKAGKTEGYLYTAEENGTLLIAVKDANGSYSKEDSHYTFKAQIAKEFTMDDLSKDNMAGIEEFPYSSKDSVDQSLTFLSDEGSDKDYFTFSVEEPKTLSFDLSGVPGVNSSIAVYFKEEFEMELPEEVLKDLPPGENPGPYPFAGANSGGKGDGEKLTFEAVPGMEYVLEVSGSPSMDRMFFDPYSMGMFEDPFASGESIIPYTLTAEEALVPADEDGLPMDGMMPEDKYMEEEIGKKEYQKIKTAEFKEAAEEEEVDYWRMFEKEQVMSIMENAVSHKIGAADEAYFQYQEDQDHFTFTADSNSILELTVSKDQQQFIYGTVFEYDEKQDDLIPLADLYGWGMFGPSIGDVKTSLAVKEGKQYVVQIQSDGPVLMEPYQFSSEVLADAPDENDIDKNEELRAKVMKPGKTYENHLVYSDDVDFYYYKNRDAEQIFNLSINPEQLTEKEKNDLPSSLHNPLIVGGIVIEDTNGNMVVDREEAGKAKEFSPGFYNQASYDVSTSFTAKENAGYFFIAFNYNWGAVSTQPYHISITSMNKKDEDAGSTVKDNIPSKPLALKAGKNEWIGEGYLNAGIDFGDSDHYQFSLDKDSDVQIEFDAGATLDGKVELFNEYGTAVSVFDLYGSGDKEISRISLRKGKYYIKVSEAFGRTSVDPYLLKITE